MADTFIETPASAARDRAEVFAAIILGIAASLAALAAYMGALADGDALQGYTESTSLLTEAAAIYEQGNLVATSDQSLSSSTPAPRSPRTRPVPTTSTS